MSISAVGNSQVLQSAVNNSTATDKPVANRAELGTATGGGAAGAIIAQPDTGGGAKSLITKVLAGGVLGAGVGFAASFFTLPVIGQVAAPIAAAVGAGVGALGGLGLHFLQKRKSNLAMKAQQEVQPPVTQPATVNANAANTLRMGSKGADTRRLQNQLKTLGLFPHKVSGEYQGSTRTAVRRYEVMKGVVPTGVATPEVLASIAQDSGLAKQHV